MEQAINVQSLAQKRRTYFKHPGSLIVFLLTWLAALLTMGVLVNSAASQIGRAHV